MNQSKGKQKTKGGKQIKEENKKTFQFYSYIVIGGNLPVLLYQFLICYNDVGWSHIGLLLFSIINYVLSIKMMSSMSNSGLDLNMEHGMGEYVKDIILVTAACQVLSCISLYCWLLWLIIPCVAFYKLWVGVIAPWVFAPAQELTDKQKKKIEKKRR